MLSTLIGVVRHAHRQPPIIRSVRWMSSPSLPRPPDLKILESPEDNHRARSWVEEFKSRQIPRELVELSFSRSSGPGGQVIPACWLVIYLCRLLTGLYVERKQSEHQGDSAMLPILKMDPSVVA